MYAVTVSLTFDWLHVLAAAGIIGLIIFVGSGAWNLYKAWLFMRGMK